MSDDQLDDDMALTVTSDTLLSLDEYVGLAVNDRCCVVVNSSFNFSTIAQQDDISL